MSEHFAFIESVFKELVSDREGEFYRDVRVVFDVDAEVLDVQVAYRME